MAEQSDYLIIGGGIMGLAVARELNARFPKAAISLIEKEDNVAQHASGRNSGVLHAGFYYSADSLKAKFCRDGNAVMRDYVRRRGLRINECGKVVVAQNESELETLHELYRRGQANGVAQKLVDEKETAEIEPNAKTYRQAIYAASTAVVDPIAI
ncbi:MAG: FAD-dependent oxidoreductase, partial [Pseudomonadota bacterium]|nr:FAD-dependent oxidoreductase [Pseudomonadota bacterium]